MNLKRIFSAVLAAVACLALLAVPSVTNAYDLVIEVTTNEDPSTDTTAFAPGDQFVVNIAFTINEADQVTTKPAGATSLPGAAALRVNFDNDKLELVDADGPTSYLDNGWVGWVSMSTVGNVEGTAPNNWRDFVTLGNLRDPNYPLFGGPGNTDPTPQIANLTFEVRNSVVAPYWPIDISVELDPGSSAPLIDTSQANFQDFDDPSGPLNILFDNSDVTGLEPVWAKVRDWKVLGE